MTTALAVPFLDLARVHGLIRRELDGVWARIADSGRFVGGEEVAAFEAAFARYCGADHCVGVGNGTDALELILEGLGIGEGDEVIVPANTFVATAEAVCRVGARPRFVDVLPDTLLIDPSAVEAAISPATAAVIGVHLFGQMFDVPRLRAVTERESLALIEDAAQAHGARFGGHRAGSVGLAAAFSFYPGKNLGALGDGGAIVSSDTTLVARIRRVADHGRSTRDRHRHGVVGRNSRLDALQAALLGVKLVRLDDDNRQRAAAMARYRQELPLAAVPVATHPAAEPVHHLAVVQVDDRDLATAAFADAQVGWAIHYPVPCHRQPAFADYLNESTPVAEAAAERILSLPLFPGITVEEIDRVCELLRSVTR